MSCYFRYITEVLNDAGIQITNQNKKDIDKAIHKIVEVEYKNCSETWKKVKEILKGKDLAKKAKFVEKLRQEYLKLA